MTDGWEDDAEPPLDVATRTFEDYFLSFADWLPE